MFRAIIVLLRDSSALVRMVQLSFLWLAAVALLHAAGSSTGNKVPPSDGERDRSSEQRVRYTASWAVEITDGGDKAADIIARRHGCRNLGKVKVTELHPCIFASLT